MGIEDYKLHGGIDSKVEEILSTGLNATPESIQGLIAELKNRNYTSDLEYLLGCLMIELLEQRLNSQGTSEVVMGYQEDLRNAISVLQSRLDDLDAGDQSAFNEIQSALNTLQTTVNSLSTTVQGKANSTDVADALALKAEKGDIVAPTWGNITGNLTDQQDLNNTLATKAGTDSVTAIQSTLSALQTAVDSLTATVQGKASVHKWEDIEIPVDGWSDSAPYTQTITVIGMVATYTPDVDVTFTSTTAIDTEESYYNCVDDIIAGTDSITLVCSKEKPAGTFHIKMKEVS
jgi:prefoldin subunit 5